MKRTFTINNVTYIAKEFDFNLVCDLEDMGISLDQLRSKPTSAVRAYFALCMDGTKEDAGNELQAHTINGGDLVDLTQAMVAEMNDSDFFQALSQRQANNQETEKPEKKSKKTAKSTETSETE